MVINPIIAGVYIYIYPIYKDSFIKRWDKCIPRYKELRPDPGTYGLDDGLMTSSLGNKGRKFGSSILSVSCMPGKKSRLVLRYYPGGTRWQQSKHARKASRLFLHIGMIQ